MSRDLVAAYMKRIGYSGDNAPTLKVLADVVTHHLRAIPFENLDPFLGRGVDIAPDAIAAKLLDQRRGGYCFEHNGLLYGALTALGFACTPLAARVVWMLPRDAPPTPRTHRLTVVQMGNDGVLIDVGFGGQSPAAPLGLVTDTAQPTSHGTYRFLQQDGTFEMQMETPQGWAGMYRFTREPQTQADFEMGNWFTSTHPRGRFTQNLVASIIDDRGRWTLFNRQLAVRAADGTAEERLIATPVELDKALREVFKIDPPVVADAIWSRLPPS